MFFKKKKRFDLPTNPLELKDGVPKVIYQICDYILTEGMIEGIFRTSGQKSEIDAITRAIKNGDEIELNKFAIHSVASSLKKYLSNLHEPLLTYEYYSDFIEAADFLDEAESYYLFYFILFYFYFYFIIFIRFFSTKKNFFFFVLQN